MLKEGRLSQWHDEKGFGFISTPEGECYFLHIKAIKRGGTARPQLNDTVIFTAGRDAQGRLQALAATVGSVAVPSRTQRKNSRNTSSTFDFIDLVSLFGDLVLFALIARSEFASTLAIAAIGISCCTFIAYWLDKSRAKNNRWRIPESTLHGWAILGGWPGAWLAQRVLRHKSSKTAFRWTYLGTLCINLAALWYLSNHSFS